MKTQTKDQSLKEFLQFTSENREVSLVVAKDQKELEGFKKELQKNDFKGLKDINKTTALLPGGAKVFIEYSKEAKKDLYDLIIQYPSGQVYLFDTKKREPVFVTPNYEESAVLLLITQSDLLEIESSGFSTLQNVGLTYKTN